MRKKIFPSVCLCTAVIKKAEFHMPAWWYGGSRAAVLDINGIELEAITRRTPLVIDAYLIAPRTLHMQTTYESLSNAL